MEGAGGYGGLASSPWERGWKAVSHQAKGCGKGAGACPGRRAVGVGRAHRGGSPGVGEGKRAHHGGGAAAGSKGQVSPNLEAPLNAAFPGGRALGGEKDNYNFDSS